MPKRCIVWPCLFKFITDWCAPPSHPMVINFLIMMKYLVPTLCRWRTFCVNGYASWPAQQLNWNWKQRRIRESAAFFHITLHYTLVVYHQSTTSSIIFHLSIMTKASGAPSSWSWFWRTPSYLGRCTDGRPPRDMDEPKVYIAITTALLPSSHLDEEGDKDEDAAASMTMTAIPHLPPNSSSTYSHSY